MATVDYIEQNPDLLTETKDLLLSQFELSTNIQGLVSVAVAAFQEVERSAVELAVERLLVNAVGAQLDEIGGQLGVSRLTATDEQYRSAIKIAGRSRHSAIDRDSLVELLSLISGNDVTDIYKGVAHYVDLSMIAYCIDPALTGPQIQDVFPLNTKLRVVAKEGTPFGFDGDSGAEGFGAYPSDDGYGNGGRFSGLIYQSPSVIS